MFGECVDQLLKLYPKPDDLLSVLGSLSGRHRDNLEREVSEHLALRICFLLLGELESSSSYETFDRRLRLRLAPGNERLFSVSDSLARTLALVSAKDDSGRLGLRALTYPHRRALFAAQNHRCAVCGFAFTGREETGDRTEYECSPTLDHKVPFRLGGEGYANLWILCGRCNGLKEARVHVGETGRPWTNNYVYSDKRRVVAFWAMWRDRQCTTDGCIKTARAGRLYVERRVARGAWVLDRCVTRCGDHIDHDRRAEY